ncbi:hypothetical protein BDR26DRAFT_870979 [Obelidium mucronatum]|nr:hypothetical protein BDR26DRAFT_870979 [Obelidium mucronatum]
MQCTGTSKDPGFQQCAAVNLQGVGTWFQKSCPTGQACLQNVASDPARGVLGKISCVAQGGNSIVQVPVGAPIATATTIQQPVTVSEKIPSSQDSAGLRIIATDPDLPQPTIDSKVEETTMILEATTQDPSTRTIDVTTSTDVPASTTSLTTTTSSTTTASSTTTTSSTSTQDQSIRSIIFTSYSTTTGNRFQASSSTNNPITGTTTPITTATSANTTLISSITVSATKLTSASTETSAVATNNGAVNDFGEAFGDSLTATTTAGPAADKANVGNGGSGSSTPLSGGTVAGIAGASAAVAIAGVVGGVLVIQRRKKSGRSDKNGRETLGESASFRLA